MHEVGMLLSLGILQYWLSVALVADILKALLVLLRTELCQCHTHTEHCKSCSIDNSSYLKQGKMFSFCSWMVWRCTRVHEFCQKNESYALGKLGQAG